MTGALTNLEKGKQMPELEVLAHSIPEFCELVGISVRHFYNLDDRGEAPPTFWLGTRRLVGHETGKSWIKEREQAAA